MNQMAKRLYKGRVALNVLANSIQNAKEVFEAAEGYVLVGVLSKNYRTVEEAVLAMKEYGKEIDDAVSIGLGSGDSRQASVVAEIAAHYAGTHINQVFPSVGATRANLGEKESWINSLVSPTGKVGYVNISTGAISSSTRETAVVHVKAAISLVRDMGGNALKYFPMNGLECENEFRAVAQACGEEQFALEPTGGIDLENFEAILQIGIDANVPIMIPHVYSSIINKQTGETNIEDVRSLLQIMKRLVDNVEE
ncbi:KDGP aldolase family protein [Radiobacillus kanasensis]|uniref:2-dehydro-3-deoxy-phosphogluconate aldolase n=1 Tax=Radiobacillus kanasensis TaxID=2844358 RepID=UPI001E464F19|nr:KDGP aldolase family protein [Radiobacillus kanasensis]UFT98683.1 KDGP aldolase family protein [Radiobacillus kanasensis]